MKDINKKILLFLILQITYPNIFYILLVPEIYTISIYVLYLLTNYITALADTLIRPLTKERHPSKIYDFLILLLFLLSPFLLIAAFYENKLLISSILPFWDNLIVSYVGFAIYLLSLKKVFNFSKRGSDSSLKHEQVSFLMILPHTGHIPWQS